MMLLFALEHTISQIELRVAWWKGMLQALKFILNGIRTLKKQMPTLQC